MRKGVDKCLVVWYIDCTKETNQIEQVKIMLKNVISAAMTGAIVMSGLAVPVVQAAQQEIIFEQEEHVCLSLNIYYEARSSNLADKAGVADVVINRMLDTRYPNTICEVVKQGQQHSNGQMKRNKCQFSWYCDGKADNPQDDDLWNESQLIAYQMLEFNRYRGITEGATHYHATYVNPSWARTLQQVGRLGAHIYYRWEG
jgi:N-acetylmuramoyl-L-alanine amidase